MNYNNFEQETNRMLELMNYGMNESASKSSAPRVEYKVKAADGLTYGIVNEGTKFYIKVAPKKDTEIVNEDFDYIGGENNKKCNEYKSYSAASKNLDLKIMQINEAYEKEQRVIVEASKKPVESDWQVNETVEMRNAIDRMNEISRNVAYILTEGEIPSEHTLPEAPAKNPSQDKVNAPYTETAAAKGDKEFTEEETNYEKPSGTPYSENAEAKENTDNIKKSEGVEGKEPYTEKAPKVNENKRRIKLTEEQVLAWSKGNDDYMDKSHGTEVGDTAPYDEKVDCKTANQCPDSNATVDESEGPIHDDDKTLMKNPGTGEVEYTSAGKDEKCDNGVVAENKFDDEDVAGFEGLEDDDDDYELPFPEVGDYDDKEDDEYELDEDELHDFGKHPAYQKQPMTTPPNKETAPNGAHEWDDESAKGEEPFGKKIGSSKPFDQVVQMLTDSIMESLGF